MGYYSNHSTSQETREKQKRERLGEEQLNNQGYLMKIVEYNMANDIMVEFQDKYKSKIRTKYSAFKKGEIRNPYHPNTLGGMTGDKYPVKVNGKTIKEYYTWYNMLKDVINNQNTIYDEWLFYENFYEWLHKQENFDKWLDGDKWNLNNNIISGNTVYSPETCFLIPYSLKQLLANLNDVNVDDLPEYLIRKHKEFTIFKIKQVAEEEYDKGNITSNCYKAIIKRLTEN